MSDFNQQIIDEFRANEGKVGGPFEGGNLLLLHTTGARSGAERVNPLAYIPLDGAYAVIGSAAGADKDPAWVHNLATYSEVEIEVGTQTLPVTATIIRTGPQRRALYDRMTEAMPGFADYEAKTSREIPVILLEPR